MNNQIYEHLCRIMEPARVRTDEPMSAHTTFRIGGPADYFVQPADETELAGVLALCRQEALEHFIIGNGSNLLVSDEGYRGLIIQLGGRFGQIRFEGTGVTAQAGARLSVIARSAMEQGLSGLEFASGIPGSLGGAVLMNAGAYGGEMKQVVTGVRLMDADGEVRTVTGEEMQFGYRYSLAQSENLIVLEAVMQLQPGQKEEISAHMEELRRRRVERQPLDLPSAGSTFKRPEGYFAGKLIMDAGLRGYRCGGAMVSGKHCGFVVNAGGATAMDVWQVMRDVRQKVQEASGVALEPEVRLLGVFPEE